MWLIELVFPQIMQNWYVEVRISRSISESPLEFEITRVDCIIFNFNIIISSSSCSTIIIIIIIIIIINIMAVIIITNLIITCFYFYCYYYYNVLPYYWVF